MQKVRYKHYFVTTILSFSYSLQNDWYVIRVKSEILYSQVIKIYPCEIRATLKLKDKIEQNIIIKRNEQFSHTSYGSGTKSLKGDKCKLHKRESEVEDNTSFLHVSKLKMKVYYLLLNTRPLLYLRCFEGIFKGFSRRWNLLMKFLNRRLFRATLIYLFCQDIEDMG